MAVKAAQATVEVAKYTKEQIVTSKKYRLRRDLLNALLDKDKSYSLEEVDKIIDNFMKRKVK